MWCAVADAKEGRIPGKNHEGDDTCHYPLHDEPDIGGHIKNFYIVVE